MFEPKNTSCDVAPLPADHVSVGVVVTPVAPLIGLGLAGAPGATAVTAMTIVLALFVSVVSEMELKMSTVAVTLLLPAGKGPMTSWCVAVCPAAKAG